ncbi:ferritin [Corynebacterium hadale]|uniref:Ferritin n=1 Tax=Corynebacterium hadale TaxID=2026255 RepID=A0A269PGB8_9CORY|nr:MULTISPECIES: ferritin [Corynebacterium]MCG7255248.1 ferritin [Corynebacterium hadale]MCG7257488.1 ferritin [Corynebacterium hadale]MCG7266221.1 ferritin [Corynebacterium hadale]PAJ71327.1 ferritin [Corynebacterium hadale]PAT02886.1 ferritin [Corynebacterium sp. NML 150383]
MDAKLYDVMNAQVTEEYLAAYLYRHLANEMTELGFDGAATWFIAQAQEEVEHAAKFTKHLQDRGQRVVLASIELDAPKIASLLEAFKASLEHEQKVTAEIRHIARVADEVGDLESRDTINWFLSEQVEEESSAQGIIDKLELVGNDGAGLLRIDEQLAQRGDN